MTESSAKLTENLSAFEFFRRDLIQNGSLVIVDLPDMYTGSGSITKS